MKGNTRVLAHLQRVLAGELAAADQSLLHSRLTERWGYARLAVSIGQSGRDQRERVDLLIQRMLLLGSTPDLNQREPLRVGATVREVLRCDLESAVEVAGSLRLSIVCCEEERDFESNRLLSELLRQVENQQIAWLEQQLGLIHALGVENFLSAQV